MKTKKWLKKPIGRVKDTLLTLAREGLSREKLTLCVALGVVLSVFPVFGTTTLLCAIAALVLRLNLPLIQLVNYAAYPLQLLLLLPFYAAGSWLFGGNLPIETGSQLTASLPHDLWSGAGQLWDLVLYAVFVWLLVSAPLVLLLYGLLKPVVEKVQSAGNGRHPTENSTKSLLGD